MEAWKSADDVRVIENQSIASGEISVDDGAGKNTGQIHLTPVYF